MRDERTAKWERVIRINGEVTNEKHRNYGKLGMQNNRQIIQVLFWYFIGWFVDRKKKFSIPIIPGYISQA